MFSDAEDMVASENCNLLKDEAGLTWDAICFVFLLLQARIYKSWYFQHVVTELEIQNMLSARYCPHSEQWFTNSNTTKVNEKIYLWQKLFHDLQLCGMKRVFIVLINVGV